MNRPDTARMAQSPHDDIIELIEIVREDEEKAAEADSDPGQDADIIELDDAIEEPLAQEESQVVFVDSKPANASHTVASPVADRAEAADTEASDMAMTAVVTEAAESVPPVCDTTVSAGQAEGAAVQALAEHAAVSSVGAEAPFDKERSLLLERIHTLEESLARSDRENEALRLRMEALEQRMAERLERNGQELALIEERTAALEAVPQISLDSVQAAMDSLSGQLNASLDAMQGNLDAVQRELYADTTLAELTTRLEPIIDKAAAQAAARVIREEISRMMAQA